MNIEASCSLDLFGSLADMGSSVGAVKGIVRYVGSCGVPAGHVRVVAVMGETSTLFPFLEGEALLVIMLTMACW